MNAQFKTAFLTGVTACALAFAAAPTRKLFSNGGFERGMSTWRLDPAQRIVSEGARSGSACLWGEVKVPNRARIARCTLSLSASNRYELTLWARATRRTKLAVWLLNKKTGKRMLVGSWKGVQRRWRRYRAGLTVSESGSYELQIAGPSSFGAPPGEMWIDDVQVTETVMPPRLCISGEQGFNDEPAMALGADGMLYAAWNSFRNGADSLQVACLKPSGLQVERLGSWQILGGKGTYLLDLRVVPGGRGAFLLYAAEKDGNWDVYAVPLSQGGPRRIVRVTSDKRCDRKPTGVWNGSGLYVFWESNRTGTHQIFCTELRDGKAGTPERVSAFDSSNYEPSVALLSDGTLCAAWYSFRNNNYDVYLRCRAPGAAWGPERRLTKAPTVDRHPVLIPHGDELWVIYENALISGYRVGTTNTRRLLLGKITDRGLLGPKDYLRSSPLMQRCEGAQACFDRRGNLHIAFLRPRLPRAGWDVYFSTFGPGGWVEPRPVSVQKGMDRPPSIVLVGSRAYIFFQADTIPQSWSDVDRTLEAVSRIYLAGLKLPDSAPGRLPLEPLPEPTDPCEAFTLRVARGEDAPTPSVTYKGRTLKLFYGDLHEHTDVSVCNRLGDQSIDESYQHMRDIVSLDFACTTDHGYNINPYLWCYSAKLARANEDPDTFLTFLAEEWTSSFERYSAEHPYGYYGHRNLILGDPYFPRWWNARNGQTPAQVWEELRKLKADFVHIPHQLADTGNVPTDWNFTDPVAQPVAEIFQVRGSYEYKGTPREAVRTTPRPGYFLQDAWARGIVIGVIASPDHGGGLGKACVFAPKLTRAEILKALRLRHCFGTTAARMFMDVRVNGLFMGEARKEPPPRSVTVEVTVRCPAPIERVEICRNNRFIYTTRPGGKECHFTFVDADPPPRKAYWYVRVIQEDGEIGWSSPVWFGAVLK